jgi:hypothetical protein
VSDSVFGPIKSPIDLRKAISETIEIWIETYLALVERTYELDPRSLPLPRSYVFKDDGTLDKRPEDQLPTIVILSPGTKGKPKREGDGMYRVPWAVNVAAIVSARNHGDSMDLATYYATAIEALFVHQGSLGGFAVGSAWEGQRTDELRSEDDHMMAAGTNVFTFTVDQVVQKGAGLRVPPENPYEDLQPIPVKKVDVDLIPEEIQ